MPASITAIWAALDELGAAARTNNPDRYRAAYRHARQLRCSDAQIKDAHAWGGKLRERDTRAVPGVPAFPEFTWKGEPR